MASPVAGCVTHEVVVSQTPAIPSRPDHTFAPGHGGTISEAARGLVTSQGKLAGEIVSNG